MFFAGFCKSVLFGFYRTVVRVVLNETVLVFSCYEIEEFVFGWRVFPGFFGFFLCGGF